MKERPILFSGEMVKAILAGRKTQTRRVVKPQFLDLTGSDDFGIMSVDYDCNNSYIKCPYGEIGDRLWVRETWNLDCDGGSMKDGVGTWFYTVNYRTDDGEKELLYAGTPEADPYVKIYDSQTGKWRPSIFMPRWASRINLEITNIRVERLQSISEYDAAAEGIKSISEFGNDADCSDYMELWESINGSGSWDKNPWVWVVEFRRVL